MGNSKMTIVFLSFKVFRNVQHFAQFAKNGNLHNKWHSKYQLFCKLMKTKFKVLMKNYLLANYRLHPFISLGSRKLANIQRSMQIRMPFVQKKKKLLPYYFGKIASPHPVKCSISHFWYYLTQTILLQYRIKWKVKLLEMWWLTGSAPDF